MLSLKDWQDPCRSRQFISTTHIYIFLSLFLSFFFFAKDYRHDIKVLAFFFISSSLAMSSGTASTISSANYCDSLVGLVKRQRRICKKNLEVMESVKLGAHEAIQECQYQFKNRRWNCSMVDPKSLFGNVLKLG